MKVPGRKLILAIITILTICLFYSLRSFAALRIPTEPPSPVLNARRIEIANAFQHAWDGYSRYCFGHDTLHPVSNTCEDDFGGFGATAIDSLSTAIILGKEDVVLQILRLIATLNFKVVKNRAKMNVFEVTIRHFGGMLSAWDLLEGPFSYIVADLELRTALYNQMVSLGDILCCAFDTPSGIPGSWMDPATCQTDQAGTNTVAGVGTMILEFAKLSDITGNKTYAELAQRGQEYLLKPQPASGEPFPGLLGSIVNLDYGDIVNSKGSWGALSDCEKLATLISEVNVDGPQTAFYEYLLKAYLYNSDYYKLYLERWLLAVDSTIRLIGPHPYGHPDWTMLASWNRGGLDRRMESLSWFAGGNIILGGMVTNNQTLIDYGLSIADAAGATYEMTTTGLGGEFVTWTTTCDLSEANHCEPKDSIRTSDSRYRLRPEVLETWYHAYRATKNPKYREWSWMAFKAINLHCRTDSGFSAIRDVNAEDGGGKIDVQETFVFAEVMKYIYLMHLEDENVAFHVQDSRTGVKNTWVFNTEAHPFRVVGQPK